MSIDDIRVTIERMNPDLKCARCWKHHVMVGADKEFNDLCPICVEVLRSTGWRKEMIEDERYTRDAQTGAPVFKEKDHEEHK